MTIAVIIKVNDGVVLASDSATTMGRRGKDGTTVITNIYENANKIFNLLKGSPIGAITWGSGSIGNASISTLAKDFRKKITYDNDWKIDPNNYTIETVAKKLRKFIFEENYEIVFKDLKNEDKPFLGFIVAGYSSGEALAEAWNFEMVKGKCIEPNLLIKKENWALSWRGQPEVIMRLYYGYSGALKNVLKKSGLDDEIITKIIKLCREEFEALFVVQAMPIQDAIDLAKFLVDTTIKYSKFIPRAQTVGGPIEVAAITKHEHFKWVQRKHYYDSKLNLDLKKH